MFDRITLFLRLKIYLDEKDVDFIRVVCIRYQDCIAQAKKKPVAATKTTAAAVPPATLKNALDSFSYAMGLSIANFYKEQGVQNINNTMVIKALNDMKAGKPSDG